MKGLYQNSKHILCLILLILASVLSTFQSQAAPPVVWKLSITSEIDPRMSHYVSKGLEEAAFHHASCIAIEMNTFGGALADAEKIRDLLLSSKAPVYVFINKNAASAGALIAIACDKIYMAQGSSIGAATVVNGEGEPAPDKYQAYMRGLMRSTAESSHRDPAIAEGMVGKPLAQDSSTIGHVITYTPSEAIAHGYCDGEAKNVEDMLQQCGLKGYSLEAYRPGNIEQIINFFMHPLLRGLLMMMIIGGLYFELQTPGIGFPLAAAITGILLYFVPSYLNGLSENWEIVLFFVGVLLLALELLFIPGFGIAGFSGIVCMFAGLILVSVNNDVLDFTFVSSAQLERLLFMTGLSLVLLFLLFFFFGKKLLQSQRFKKITLQDQELSEEGYRSSALNHLTGETGKTFTDLRPAGKVIIQGKLYDAFTAGEFIPVDTEVEVRTIRLGSLQVKKKM